MHSNTMKHTKTWVWGSTGVDQDVRCKKLQHDFMARTFAFVAPVQYVLQQVSCSYETIRDAPKHNETHQNKSLRSNVVDQVRSLQKITTWLRGTDFCINCTCSPRFAQSFISYETIPNAPKHYETHQNMNLGSNGIDWVRSLWKNYNVTSWHELLH